MLNWYYYGLKEIKEKKRKHKRLYDDLYILRLRNDIKNRKHGI